MTIPSVIKIIEENMKNNHKNIYPYQIGQKTILNMLKLKI